MQTRRLTLLLPIFAAAAAAAGCASKPHPSPPAPVAATTAGRFDPQGHPVIVRMAGRSNALTIASTPSGPAYSVADAKGQVLLSAGTLDDLRRVDPLLYRQVKTGLVDSADRGTRAAVTRSAERWDDDPWEGQLLAR